MSVPQGTGLSKEAALRIRIRIIFGSWIRIRIKVKIQKLGEAQK
jgi:hypothetical protein